MTDAEKLQDTQLRTACLQMASALPFDGKEGILEAAKAFYAFAKGEVPKPDEILS